MLEDMEKRRRMMVDGTKFEQQSWPRPIPVSERLPEVGERVLWLQDGTWEAGVFKGQWGMDMPDFNTKATDSRYDPDYDGYGSVTIERDAVTHWLPLPPPPTE